jgi:hypothetical protein
VLIIVSTNQFEDVVTDVGVTILNSRKVIHDGLPTKIYVVKL